MRSNRRAKLPSQYVLVFQGILFVACLSSVCTEDVDWESLYGATKGEDPCTGDNAPMECSIRHDSLFGRAEDDSQQHGGAESERVAGNFRSAPARKGKPCVGSVHLRSQLSRHIAGSSVYV